MFLVYFDESGDPGAIEGSTKCFVVTGIILHETNWLRVFEEFKKFRNKLRREHDIPTHVELKGYNIVNRKKEFKRVKNSNRGDIELWERMIILRKIIDFLSDLHPFIECQNVCFRKTKSVTRTNDEASQIVARRFELTWEFALQRIEAHIYYKEKELIKHHRNFNTDIPLPETSEWLLTKLKSEFAMFFPDNTDNEHLRKLSRRMHTVNYVPYKHAKGQRHLPISHVLGDPYFQDSKHNYFIQFADVIAYCLSKHYFPETVPLDYKKLKVSASYRLENLFPMLDPILCKEAAMEEPLGVKFLEDK